MTSPTKRDAVDTFLAMELHVADCARCAITERKFAEAMKDDDLTVARTLSRQFCPEMQRLAERLYSTRSAFEVTP